MGSRLPVRVCWGPCRSHPDLSPVASGLGRSHHELASVVELRFGEGDISKQTQVPEEDFPEPFLSSSPSASLKPLESNFLTKRSVSWDFLLSQLGETGSVINYTPEC